MLVTWVSVTLIYKEDKISEYVPILVQRRRDDTWIEKTEKDELLLIYTEMLIDWLAFCHWIGVTWSRLHVIIKQRFFLGFCPSAIIHKSDWKRFRLWWEHAHLHWYPTPWRNRLRRTLESVYEKMHFRWRFLRISEDGRPNRRKNSPCSNEKSEYILNTQSVKCKMFEITGWLHRGTQRLFSVK